MPVILDHEVRAIELTTGITEIRATRAADGKPAMLAGYAAPYDKRTAAKIWGEFWEIIRRGAFAAALAGKEDVRMLHSHDSAVVLGRTKAKTLRLSDDAVGLAFEVDLPATTAANDLVISVERGDITQMSFGFRPTKVRWSEEAAADGRMESVRELLEVQLLEISPVAFPAYAETEIGVRDLVLAECRSSRATAKPPEALNANAKARLRLAS